MGVLAASKEVPVIESEPSPPMSSWSGSRLVLGGAPLVTLSGMVQPELIAAFDAPAAGPDTLDGLILRTASGADLAARLIDMGYTENHVRTSLGTALDLAQDAHRQLPASVRKKLDWPVLTQRLDADGWLMAYALVGPVDWVIDLAGGLSHAALLRCCLLASPGAEAELWLPMGLYPPPRTVRARPAHAPVSATSASSLLLLRRESTQPVQKSRQQP